jgi:integrase
MSSTTVTASAAKAQRRVALGGGLYQKGSDRFLVIIRKDGAQHVKALQARNRTDAKREAPGVIAELLGQRGIAVGDRKVTLRQLADDFLAHEAGPSGRLSARTRELRRLLLDKHVLPLLGERTRAEDLSVAHVRRLIDKLNRKGFSGSHVRSCITSLSCILDHGCRNDSLSRNVTRDLTRRDLPSGKRQTEPRYLTIDEIGTLFSKLGDEFRPVAQACFYACLRISEALALRWSDIDFEAGTINVRGTKTEASAAVLPLHPKLAAELKAHRQRQAALGVQRIASSALVFQTYTGQPQGRRNALRAVNAASIKAGLSAKVRAREAAKGEEPVGLHDLRHSLVANAFALGYSPIEVSKIARHANPQVTLTVYAGLAGDQVEVLRDKLAAIGGAS